MRIKDVVNLCNVKTDDHSKPYVALENIESWNSKFIPSESVSEGMNNVFDAGDILFGKLRPYLAKAYIPNFDGICSTEFFVLKPKKGFDSRYLLYRLLMPSFIWYINSRVTGVKMPRTNWNDFSNVEIDIPSLPVQRRIVSYLDSKTSEIDQAISLLERKREAYTRLKASVINRAVTRGLNPNVKLKDSGVEWIGRIPEEWKVKHFKRLMSIRNGSDYKHVISDDGYPVIGSGGIFEHASQYLYDGEVLLLGRKGTIDKPLYFSGKFWTVDTMFYCVPNKDVCCKYMYYQALIVPLLKYSTQTALPSMTMISLNYIPYCVPPLTEQRSIASYLDAECSKIDRAASIVEKQIDAYKRLKRSLINEVVTGKRKVD